MNVLHIEQKVKVNDHVYGTADAVVWQPEQQHLHVVDLKYGAGVAVEVAGNLQLKIYALATLLTFGYPARQVTATIVQPRCPHSDGPIRSVTFDTVDLLDLNADIIDAMNRIQALAGVPVQDWPCDALNVSEKGCRWCRAAPICPAQKQLAQTTAKKVFAPGLPYDPADLADTLEFLPIIEAWIKNTREFAYAEAEKGNGIPRWKLVEKRATRKWRGGDMETADRLWALTDLGKDDVYTDPELKSPAAIEKLLPKEQRGILEDLCVKESSGHALVHESDKRPAVALDAKTVFENT